VTERFPAKTLHDLEWRKLLEHLATRATSDLAADRCRELPFLEPTAALEHLELVRELASCIERGDPPPALPARDVGETLSQIRGAGAVEAGSLIDLALNLKLFNAIARYLDNRRDTCPRNWAVVLAPERAPSQIAVARLAAEIESAFEPDGTIADGASADIGPLRRKVVSLREALLDRIEGIAEQDDDLLQERTVTLRNNRFVLPVRADAHRRLRGIVHGTSGTGATIFVEPEGVVDLGNQLMLAREEVLREEARIVAELRGAVRDMLDEVGYTCEAIVDSETRIAAARLSQDLEASIPQPDQPGSAEIFGARHPLLVLEGVKVVPGDLSIRPGQAMLISGPNAGGKTVVLKTVGLLGLMLAAGLPLPLAPESRFGVPQNVLTDIGDDQSLELSLSTFSAHMKNIAAALDASGTGSVVLLDELAAGTDPAEGAALAEAVLSHLSQLGATTLATTHYDVLKTRAQDQEGFVNAAMGFDVEGARPTFEIRLGLPGSSSALTVAERFGIPQPVVERAVELLPDGVRELAGAVEALEKEKARAALERQALAEQRKVLEDAAQRHERELQHLRARQDRFVDDETRALWSAIRRAREKVRHAERTARRRSSGTDVVRKARDQVNAIAEKLEPGGELNPTNADDLPGRPAHTKDLEEGARVYVVSLRKEAIVDSLVKGGRIYALCGPVRMRLEVGDLRVVDSRTGSQQPRRQRVELPEAAAGSTREREAIRTSENTLDMRGMTVDEALSATDAFLDKALRDGLDAVFLIHGHGTGALRDAVRDYLAGSPYVADFRPGQREEGGDGISVAWIA
jgi:DNA mismatch repair protein MutS2